jgi:hypothetical protein
MTMTRLAERTSLSRDGHAAVHHPAAHGKDLGRGAQQGAVAVVVAVDDLEEALQHGRGGGHGGQRVHRRRVVDGQRGHLAGAAAHAALVAGLARAHDELVAAQHREFLVDEQAHRVAHAPASAPRWRCR